MPYLLSNSKKKTLCVISLFSIKLRSPLCSGFVFPHSLSPRSIAQLPSVHWPEVMAAHVDPIPLSDTPPPLPAKKHRRQQQVTDSKLITWDYFVWLVLLRWPWSWFTCEVLRVIWQIISWLCLQSVVLKGTAHLKINTMHYRMLLNKNSPYINNPEANTNI